MSFKWGRRHNYLKRVKERRLGLEVIVSLNLREKIYKASQIQFKNLFQISEFQILWVLARLIQLPTRLLNGFLVLLKKKNNLIKNLQLLPILGFAQEAKLGSSKHLTQVHLKMLSRILENLASHLMTKYITWGTRCQSSSESWQRCTPLSFGFHFLLVMYVLKCGVGHTWRRSGCKKRQCKKRLTLSLSCFWNST